MFTYKDIMEKTGYSRNKSYEILRTPLDDFKKDYSKAMTFKGRIQKDYFYKKNLW